MYRINIPYTVCLLISPYNSDWQCNSDIGIAGNIHNDPIVASCVSYFIDATDKHTTSKTAQNCKEMLKASKTFAETTYGCKVKSVVTDNAKNNETYEKRPGRRGTQNDYLWVPSQFLARTSSCSFQSRSSSMWSKSRNTSVIITSPVNIWTYLAQSSPSYLEIPEWRANCLA